MMHLAGALRVVVRGREIESCVHVGAPWSRLRLVYVKNHMQFRYSLSSLITY